MSKARLELARESQRQARKKVRAEMDDNPVTSPYHYKVAGIEVRDIQEELCENLSGLPACDYGNAIKYLLRAYRKGNPLQDLKKSRFHIEALMQILEDHNDSRT